MTLLVEKPRWTPNFFLGCDAFTWLRLLVRHRFAVDRSRWRVAAIVSAASVANTVLHWAQRAIYGPAIARTAIGRPPVFILGHWRSGTTLLHELLACDPRHAFPTTYECLAPHHALLTQSWLPRWLSSLVPDRRPMDNMAVGFDRPQEDEFALCLLGQPSPYERVAFPRDPLAGDLSPETVLRWKTVYQRLLQEWTYSKGGRRLVLKSPPHMARLGILLEMFPDARFIHLIRNPYAIFPSTLHLWRTLTTLHGFQRPSWAGLEEQILDTFVQMYDRLEADKPRVRPERFHELRYEDLVRDPLGRLETLYRELDLGDFDTARPHVEAYVAGLKGYETNRYILTPMERAAIAHRWGAIIRRYGYDQTLSEPEA